MANKTAIIASNGSAFDAYKVFNIATAAASADYEVTIFFTFEGLNLIHKEGYKTCRCQQEKKILLKDLKQQMFLQSRNWLKWL